MPCRRATGAWRTLNARTSRKVCGSVSRAPSTHRGRLPRVGTARGRGVAQATSHPRARASPCRWRTSSPRRYMLLHPGWEPLLAASERLYVASRRRKQRLPCPRSASACMEEESTCSSNAFLKPGSACDNEACRMEPRPRQSKFAGVCSPSALFRRHISCTLS